MNRHTLTQRPIVAALLACLLTTQTASAIKIVVPEQYQEKVTAINEAERAQRSQELQGARAAEPGQAGFEKEGGIEAASGRPAPASPAADEFLVQSVVEANDTAAAFAGTLSADEGIISGQVVDKETGQPVSGAAILIEGTDIATVTDESGRYSIGPAPAGSYTLSFIKGGYIEANVTEYKVAGGEVSVFPFALPPRPAEMSDEVYELQDFTVTAEQANELMLALDLRMNSDSIMNVMTSEDFSRFAASDVGDAIKRVAGITVEGGQFAVIRGLDERYSSTTLNGAPVPSPDPDRQSVPLDLFPSDIVSNLTVSKTFTPDLPGNSAGGAINIMTNTFPEEWILEVGVKTGFNDRATDQFLERGGPSARSLDLSKSASEIENSIDFTSGGGVVAVESEADREVEFNFKLGGTTEWMGRTLRVLASAGVEKDYDTIEGFEESRFARGGRSIFIPFTFANGRQIARPLRLFNIGPPAQGLELGDLAKGELTGTNGRFDLTESKKSERNTYLFASELDLDREGEHRIGLTYFRNQEDSDIASLRSNGTYDVPNPITAFDQSNLRPDLASDLGIPFEDVLALKFFESTVLRTERELEIVQVSGTHRPENLLAGLDLDWMLSRSESSQQEKDVASTAAIFDPSDGEFFTGASQDVNFLNPSFAWRDVLEEQDFGRMDANYTTDFGSDVTYTFGTGYSSERTERDTRQFFYRVRLLKFDPKSSRDPKFFDLEDAILDKLVDGKRDNVAQPFALATGQREVDAFYFSNKVTLFDDLDLLAGVRFEKVLMTTGTNTDGSDFFNSELLQGDPSDTSNPGTKNAAILGFNNGQPLPAGFVGEIDENVALPSLGITYRPIEGARLSLAYSETLVRPSFKEFTFITSQNPETLDFESGNPTLETSDVRSADFRAEYTWGRGDMVAVALFYKEIDNPIEKTTLFGTVESDLFFNNPNTAEIRGVEFEFRKSLDFLGESVFEYFTFGGNFALIDATVDIPENFRKFLSGGVVTEAGGVIGGGAYADPSQTDNNGFQEAPKERQLFQQPEWIVNLDLSFEQPDWGTRATLSFFSQSDVLDRAAGLVERERVTVDEFQKSFEEINFTFSQRLTDHLSLGFGVKNLTDSERGIKYADFVGGGSKRSYKVGRSYSLSITGSF